MKILDGRPYIPQIRKLIEEYTSWLGRDLTFQNLEEELRDPAKKYTPPQGEVLVAEEAGRIIGMIAYHRHTDRRCEMKRLYVNPEYRGRNAGERLIETLIEHAKAAGYQEMVLDSIVSLQAAIHLYKKLGFQECEPYYENPMSDAIYMRRAL